MIDQYKVLKARYLDKNAPSIDSKYMIVTAAKFTGKTWVYGVVAKKTLVTLGVIKWRGSWRSYWFEPESNTGFSEGCVGDIQTFIGLLREERKAIKKTKLRTN